MIISVMKRGTVALLLAFVSIQLVFAQNEDPAAQFKTKIFPPSPEAASLGKYGDYPVSLSNGLTNISVPLYEINTGKIKLPISFSYHQSGVKAYDISSAVGLGWSLSANYSISRVIKGHPDEATYGILNNPLPQPDDPGEHYSCFIANLARPNHAVDGQPDIFYLNLGGFNGKFLFKTGADPSVPYEIVTIPYSLLKIKVNSDFTEFSITDVDGTSYIFGKVETTRVMTEDGQHSNGPSAWYITSIVSADKSDVMTFTYTEPSLVVTSQSSTALSVKKDSELSLAGCLSYSHSSATTYHMSVLVKDITFRNGKVSFDYTPDREDLSNAQRLRTIKIFQGKDDALIEKKRFTLSQTYFRAAGGQTSQVESVLIRLGQVDEKNKRLRLDALYEQGFGDGVTVTKPPYTFTYEKGDHLPAYGTTAQDFMGYYNGAHDNTNLLFYDYGVGELGPEVSQSHGANRKTNSSYIDAGILTRIDFPTGGYTVFEVEPNQVNYQATVTEPGVVADSHTITSRDLTVNHVTFTITLPAGADANTLTGYLSCSLVNNLKDQYGNDAPKISTSVTLLDETTGQLANIIPQRGGYLQSAMYGLPAELKGFTAKDELVLFPNHTYTLSYGTSVPVTNNFLYTTVSWQANNGTVTRNINDTYYTGGLRIKSITKNDGEGNIVKKKYAYTKWYYNSNLFKGDVGQMADQFKGRCKVFVPVDTRNAAYWYDVYGENITFELGSSTNTTASYEEVEEYQVDLQDKPLGKTVTTFNNAVDQISSWSPYFRSDEEWRRGQVLNQKTCKFNPSSPANPYTTIKEVTNVYENKLLFGIEYVFAVVFENVDPAVVQLMFKECGVPVGYVYKVGNISQNIFKGDLVKSTTTEYDQNGDNGKSTELQFVYDQTKHRQLIRTISQTSDNRWLTTNLKYSPDFAVSPCDEQTCFTSFNAAIDALLVEKKSCELQNYNDYLSHRAEANAIENVIKLQYDSDWEYCDTLVPVVGDICKSDATDRYYKSLENNVQLKAENALADAAFDAYLQCAATFHTAVLNAIPAFNSCRANYTSCTTSFLTSAASDRDKGLLLLQLNNVVSPVVESNGGFMEGSVTGTEYTTFGVRTDFKPATSGGVAVPDMIWRFDASAKVAKSVVDANAVSYYRKIGSFPKYDNRNNLAQRSKDSDVISSYIWDYDAQYPIAEAINATVDDIAFTSFEADGTGNWVIPSSVRYNEARTGMKCYDIVNGSIRKNGLVQGRNYVVSFWAKTNSNILVNGTAASASGPVIGDWQYYDMKITGSTTVTDIVISGTGYIDELRLAPANALMTTYTYEPLVGIRSVTDANNQSVFYEYDALQRLKLVRDSKLNPLKTYTYHYAGQN